MLTGKTMPAAKKVMTIFAVERKVYLLPAQETVLIDRRFFLPE